MTRNEVQTNIKKQLEKLPDTLLHCSIRVGKTKIALDMIKKNEIVLWIYPRNSMLEDYELDIKQFKPKSKNITFINKSSLKNIKEKSWDYIIIDEPQDLSAANIKLLKTFKFNRRLGLSGSLSTKTQTLLESELNWKVGVSYTTQDAIADGLIKDYKIRLHYISLDNNWKVIKFKKFGKEVTGTEIEAYDAYTSTMKYFEVQKEQAIISGDRVKAIKCSFGAKKYMQLRTNLLYNSISALSLAKSIAKKLENKKLLIYTLRTDIADDLAEATYHTKNKEDEILLWFKHSEKGHLAVVNCVTTGVTIRNINNVLFHSYDSNTENFIQKLGRSLLAEEDDNLSTIDVCVLKNTRAEVWVDTACSLLDINKIFYVEGDQEYTKIEWLKKTYPDKELFQIKDSTSIVFRNGNTVDDYPGYSFFSSPETVYGYKSEKLEKI